MSSTPVLCGGNPTDDVHPLFTELTGQDLWASILTQPRSGEDHGTPRTIIEKYYQQPFFFAQGNKVLVAEVFAKNGFLVLDIITGEEQAAEVNADRIDQDEAGGDSGYQRMTTNKRKI